VFSQPQFLPGELENDLPSELHVERLARGRLVIELGQSVESRVVESELCGTSYFASKDWALWAHTADGSVVKPVSPKM